MTEELFYQENDSGLFIRARGHITAAVSTDLRELILGRLTQAPVPPVLAVDLSGCDYMDSTFMGLLVGFHKRYKALTGRSLTVLRPTPECRKLLQGLGILGLMALVEGDEVPVPSEWKDLRARRAPETETVLHAHRNLSEISPENKAKFAALEEVLRRDLDPSSSS